MSKSFILLTLIVLLHLFLQAEALASSTSEILPRRIVSLGPINTENIFLLGAGDRLVADTIYCVRPEEARHREKIGSMMEINIEKIVAIKPDLVLATALTPKTAVNKLKSLGIKVKVFQKAHSFDDICSQFLVLGRLLGLEARAEAIVKRVREEVLCIRRAVASLHPKRVLLQVGANPLFASVKGTFTSDYIKFANAINITEDQRSGATSREKAAALDPEVIIVAIMGTESGAAAQEKKRWLKIEGISAVKSGQVYTADPDIICSPSPITFVKALHLVASLIHPEAGGAVRGCIESR